MPLGGYRKLRFLSDPPRLEQEGERRAGDWISAGRYRKCTMPPPCAGREEWRWYVKQDAALQMRIRMLACFVADLKGTEMSQELPGACSGARQDRTTFEDIVTLLVTPSLRVKEATAN